MWQDHREVVQFAFDAADHADRLSEVDLRVPRRMSERYEHLPRPALLLPDIVGDDDDAACEPVLVAQTLENTLRRVPLLLQLGFVLLQYLSMIGMKGSSFGRTVGFDRRYPGGTECSSIFATVLRSMLNSRTASLLLIP